VKGASRMDGRAKRVLDEGSETYLQCIGFCSV
jgi:hypothetical protein